jgi:hypothetical protein
MSNIEVITITLSSIAIGVAVVSAIAFWWYQNLQKWYRFLQGRDGKKGAREASIETSDTRAVLDLFTSSLRDDLGADSREVLETILRMNSQTPLISVLDDPADRFYLFEALADPSRFPWEKEEEEAVQKQHARR